MRIYIRHGHKTHRNGKTVADGTYQHDPEITEQGKEEARKLAMNLIKRYGVPTIIVCSPFLRCRQTANELAKSVNSYVNSRFSKAYHTKESLIISSHTRTLDSTKNIKPNIEISDTYQVGIRCDPLLSEYLGNQYQLQLNANIKEINFDIHPDTRKFNPPLYEDIFKLECRVRDHNDAMRDFDVTKDVVWFVTHGVVLGKVMSSMGFKAATVPYLTSFVVRQSGGKKGKVHGNLIKDGVYQRTRRA